MNRPGLVPQAVAGARAVLVDSGYSSAGIARLGIDLGMGVRAIDIPLLQRALEPVEPLASLIRLFVLGQRLAADDLVRALGSPAAEALVGAGLTEALGDDVRPIVRVTPWRGLLFAHDPDPVGDLWADHVSGPTPAADTLMRLVSPNGGTALDLGTGAGLFALVLAHGQRDVTATDLNLAALRLVELNCGLNDIRNVRPAAGDLFQPVGDAVFDLIVSNPPFVISPESELLFRHSPFGRDEISRQVIRSATDHLREGGVAYVLVNWVQEAGGSWFDSVKEWLVGTGCDALVMLHGVDDPLAYAVRWTAREQLLRADRHGATLDRWLRHFQGERIEAIGSGAIVLRRRAGRNWIHCLELRGDATGDAGPQVQAIMDGRDFLSGIGSASEASDDDLLRSVFRMREPHRLTQTLAAQGGEYVAEPAILTLEVGLDLGVLVPNDMVQVVLRLDGSQTAADIVGEVGAATGTDLDSLSTRVASYLRELLGTGMLESVLPRYPTRPQD